MTLPRSSGLGLKSEHYDSVLELSHGIEWFECHPENYMNSGGLSHHYLNAIRQNYELSLHGVGMSLGSAQGIDPHHLERLVELVKRYQPASVSEHIAWSHGRSAFHNDLLPIPYNSSSLETICINIDQVQTALGQTIAVENPSSYLGFTQSDMSEPEFITAMQQQSGCHLLLDINNVYVSAKNLGFCEQQYLNEYPLHAVSEIHLAGHSVELITLDSAADEREKTESNIMKTGDSESQSLLIDDHGSEVSQAVWQLYEQTLRLCKQSVPSLIEWDTNVPKFEVLQQQAQIAQQLMDSIQLQRQAQ